MDSIRIVVIGAGAIGGVTAALMKQGGSDVTLVCKHQEIADIASGRGLHITGVRGEHMVHLDAVADIAELDGTYDVALIATKAYDMPACARGAVALSERQFAGSEPAERHLHRRAGLR